MSYELGEVGDELFPNIHIGDRVKVKDDRWRYVSNILPTSTRSTQVVLTDQHPDNWESNEAAHGTWTQIERLILEAPTDEEIAKLFGLTP